MGKRGCILRNHAYENLTPPGRADSSRRQPLCPIRCSGPALPWGGAAFLAGQNVSSALCPEPRTAKGTDVTGPVAPFVVSATCGPEAGAPVVSTG